MTQYRLLTQERELLERIARQPASAPLAAPWLPRTKIVDAYTMKDYTMKRVEPPMGSALGELSHGVSSARTETERDIITFRYTYNINKTDLRIAGRNDYDIVGQNFTMMRSAMEHQILNMVFQGTPTTSTSHLPDISGMFDVYEDVNASLDDQYWDTATKPLVHIAAGFSDLIANNYYPPFSFIGSWNLKAGMMALNNAAEPDSHEQIALRSYLQGGACYYYQCPAASAASAYGAGGYTIYPLPAPATDDGVWLMFAPRNGAGELNFYLAEVSNGIETSVRDFVDENNNYTYDMEWRGTIVFRGATTGSASSAPYIVGEPDVDLAA